jgi:hypothetical protein
MQFIQPVCRASRRPFRLCRGTRRLCPLTAETARLPLQHSQFGLEPARRRFERVQFRGQCRPLPRDRIQPAVERVELCRGILGSSIGILEFAPGLLPLAL